MTGAIENLLTGLLASAVTAVVVWAWGRLARVRRRARRAAFFGLSPGDPCVVVMNRHARTPDAMHHNDVDGLVDLIRLVDDIGAEPRVVRFDRLLEPAGETTELCVGGPVSNERTRVHLRTYLPGVSMAELTTDDPADTAIVVGDEHFAYERREREHALLARFFPEASTHPVILISGQSSLANRAAISYLARHYERGIRTTHEDGTQFCLVLTLRSPSVYGVKSVHLASDVTGAAFAPAATTGAPGDGDGSGGRAPGDGAPDTGDHTDDPSQAVA